MLDVDRSTVYRMAEDGRLPAIKVGRQWRFPADRVRAVLTLPPPPVDLAGPRPAPEPTSPDVARAIPADVARAIPADVAGPVAQVAADLLGVMVVVTDMDGHPLTQVCNPCARFEQRSGDPALLDACIAEWRQLADDPDFAPRFAVATLGFECARAFVRTGTSLVGMVLAGGVAPAGVTGGDAAGLYVLDAAERRRVLSALPQVAAALSQVGPRGSRRSEP